MTGLFLCACSAVEPTSSSTSGALTRASYDTPGDKADNGCDVVLRTVYVDDQTGTSDCSSTLCWLELNGTVDVSASAIDLGAQPAVLVQNAVDGSWRQVTATPIWGAGLGFRRFQFRVAQNTAQPGGTVALIPFLRTSQGRLFDHNRVDDSLGAYTVTESTEVQADDSCAAEPPHGIRNLVFADGWQNSGYGELVQSGKLDVNYDIHRIPSGIGCTTDGMRAFAFTAYAQFQPSGVTTVERIDGLDASGDLTSLPLEWDVPADATSVSVWFLDSSECRGNEYDSAYGANYVYPIAQQ